MKKVLLSAALILGSAFLVNCGGSNSSTATAPGQGCASNDPTYGCVQTSSTCEPGSADCIRVTPLMEQRLSCRGECGTGEIQIGVNPLECLPRSNCGTCAANNGGACVPALVEYEGEYTHPVFVNGHIYLEHRTEEQHGGGDNHRAHGPHRPVKR